MSYWGNPITISSQPTSPTDNNQSTRATIERMIVLARDSARYPAVNSLVSQLQQSLPTRASDSALVDRLFWWIKQHVTFREDEDILVSVLGYQDPYQELLISPVALLAMPSPQGDCDDFAMLLASLLIAAGLPNWFVAIAADEKEQDRWSHIYNKVYLKDECRYVVLDASYGYYPGWETSRRKFKQMEWRVG